jgi:hypothetical protein
MTKGNKIQIAIAVILGLIVLTMIAGGMSKAAYHKKAAAQRRYY